MHDAVFQHEEREAAEEHEVSSNFFKISFVIFVILCVLRV